jgi:hypothetical protein
MCGSAYKNKGVQLLLDGVDYYLPEPDRRRERRASTSTATRPRSPGLDDPSKPLVMLAFKLEDGRYGQLTYVRVYQGTLRRATPSSTCAPSKKVKVGRIVRMHSNEMEDIEDACAGDIVRPVRRRLQLRRHLHGRHRQHGHDLDVRARAGHQADAIKPKDSKSQINMARRSSASPRRTRPSDLRGRENPARPSSAAWASCTSRSTSSA